MSRSSVQTGTLKYRADIDGLRAVAVLSVLAFHAGLHGSTGGFVGVDVFFVISGYLISSIVFSEIAGSRFSIIGFYERRIRRIFPALFAMLAVFTVLASIYLLPFELGTYSKSLLAATTSVSNFYFWRHSGYFDSPTQNPLLHTWSLAVEEQFYILFPIFLVIVRRFLSKQLRISVIALFLVSLAASAIIVHYSSTTAFYMPYTRAWELLLGTMLSLGLFPRLHSRLTRNIATLAGIGMIAFCIDRFSVLTLFPGLTALVPCIGSALIIGAGESGSSLISTVLSWRPVVFIGLISYSLYLWHWPVIVLFDLGIFSVNEILPARLAKLISANTYAQVLEISVSLLLGIASWRFVERPFRSGSLRLGGRRLFALAGSVMLIFISYSSFVVLSGGLPDRFSPESVQLASYLETGKEDKLNRVGTCFITLGQPLSDYNHDLCLHRDEGKKTYLLLGDSHSAVLWRALSISLPDANIMQASCVGSRPVVHAIADRECRKMMDYIFQSYLPAHPVQGLLLEGQWQPADIGELAETLDWARQHRVPVILFGPVPEYDVPLPRLLAYSVSWKEPDLASQHLLPDRAALDAQLQNLAANTWHVHYISLYQTICNRDGCMEYADEARKVPLMVDSHHLSSAGSLLIVRRLIAQGDLRLPLPL